MLENTSLYPIVLILCIHDLDKKMIKFNGWIDEIQSSTM